MNRPDIKIGPRPESHQPTEGPTLLGANHVDGSSNHPSRLAASRQVSSRVLPQELHADLGLLDDASAVGADI